MKRILAAARLCVVCAVRAIRSPADIVLMVRIAAFIRRLPERLGRTDMVTFLRTLREAPRPASSDPQRSAARVQRVRNAVLSLPSFWKVNTCYVRALTLYRFIDPGEHEVRLHLGLEQQERLHGHAWVTLDRELLEAPDGVVLQGLIELPLDATA